MRTDPSIAHVIAPPAATCSPTSRGRDRSTDAACILLADRLAGEQHDHRVICLGPRASERTLAAFGLAPTATVLPRHTDPGTGRRRLRAHLAGALEVHVWGVRSLAATLSAAPRAAAVHLHADDAPPGRLNRRSLARLASVAAFDAGDAEAWVDAGVPSDRIAATDPRPVAPADERDRVRRAFGIHPDAVVIAPLWDPGSTLDARRFVFRVGFLELLNRPTVAVFPSSARRLAAARRFRSAASLRFRMLISQAPVASIFPACDALVPMDAEVGLPAPARGARAIVAAHARRLGVPVAEPVRSDAPPMVSREMAEFMEPLIAQVDSRSVQASGSEAATP